MFTVHDGIKLYAGHTQENLIRYEHNIALFKRLYGDNEPIISPLKPSMLTAEGKFSNISFNEAVIFNLLTVPTGHIIMAGCNYGEVFNPLYKKRRVKKTTEKQSQRGRKKKVKTKIRRKMQGSGKYFSSQITFEILHPDMNVVYKIKLFRNGKFQAPGIRRPDMLDLIKPINILRDYLHLNFSPNVSVLQVTAVLRNYKANLINKNYHVDLEKIEDILTKYKKNSCPELAEYMHEPVILSEAQLNDVVVSEALDNIKNSLRIAEMTYNTDRCFSLNIKFQRPSLLDPYKKTTVKLLKKGKLNWDGFTSEYEVMELYHWVHWIYLKHKDEILFDIEKIILDNDMSDTDACSIYDEEYVLDTDNLNKVATGITDEQRSDIGSLDYARIVDEFKISLKQDNYDVQHDDDDADQSDDEQESEQQEQEEDEPEQEEKNTTS